MPPGGTRSLAVVVCALLGALTTLVASRPPGATRAEDRNRDGRPDVWQSFDRNGGIARISVDTNFDGRSDIEEFYEAGTLVRRQTDSDFDDRIDLVQHFDPPLTPYAPVGMLLHSEERSAFGAVSQVVVVEVDDLPTAHAAHFQPALLRLVAFSLSSRLGNLKDGRHVAGQAMPPEHCAGRHRI